MPITKEKKIISYHHTSWSQIKIGKGKLCHTFKIRASSKGAWIPPDSKTEATKVILKIEL